LTYPFPKFNSLPRDIEIAETPKAQQDVKKWLALTSTVLTNNYRESMIQARDGSLDLLLNNMKEHLETVTTLKFTDAIRRRLSEAVAPHLTTLRLLHYQEWDHKLNMVDASRKGAPVFFSPARMKGMFWEETGFVQASLFPQLLRIEGNVRVVEDDEDDEDIEEDDEVEDEVRQDKIFQQSSLLTNDQYGNYTVICKARVAVVPDLDEDMEDAEDVGVEAETDQKASGSPREEATGKSMETTRLKQESDQNLSQVHDTTSERDVGEPMDEDTMSDLPGEGVQVTVESLKTLERKPSAIVIPDSSDGAEELTAKDRGWPY
jgi:hypothetical protein